MDYLLNQKLLSSVTNYKGEEQKEKERHKGSKIVTLLFHIKIEESGTDERVVNPTGKICTVTNLSFTLD